MYQFRLQRTDGSPADLKPTFRSAPGMSWNVGDMRYQRSALSTLARWLVRARPIFVVEPEKPK